MKNPLWLHVLVGVVLISTGILAWHSWMIMTKENPTVILNHHNYISECAWLDDKEKQALWDEMGKHESSIKRIIAGCLLTIHGVDKLRKDTELSFTNMDARNQSDFTDIRVDVKALDKRVTEIEKKPKQHRHGCGEW